jgi:hypothetical protein
MIKRAINFVVVRELAPTTYGNITVGITKKENALLNPLDVESADGGDIDQQHH